MHDISSSQFFRTTAGMKSGQDAFDESRYIKMFLNILGITEVLHSFRLVLKETPESSRLGFLENLLENNCFIRCRRQQLGLLNRGGIGYLSLLRNY